MMRFRGGKGTNETLTPGSYMVDSHEDMGSESALGGSD